MSAAATGGYVYGSLGTAVTLTPGNSYALGSSEGWGANDDYWYDVANVTAAPNTITVNSGAYSTDGVTWLNGGSASQAYGPVNLMIGGGGGGGSSLPLIHFQEMYKYNSAGLMLGKRLWAESGGATDALEAEYTFDSEGRMATQKYPDALAVGATFGDADTMGETFAYMGSTRWGGRMR